MKYLSFKYFKHKNSKPISDLLFLFKIKNTAKIPKKTIKKFLINPKKYDCKNGFLINNNKKLGSIKYDYAFTLNDINNIREDQFDYLSYYNRRLYSEK